MQVYLSSSICLKLPLIHISLVFTSLTVWSILAATLAAEMEEMFHSTALEAGLMFGVSSASYVVGCLFIGWVSDLKASWPRRTGIIGGLVLGGIGALLTGPSTIVQEMFGWKPSLNMYCESASVFRCVASPGSLLFRRSCYVCYWCRKCSCVPRLSFQIAFSCCVFSMIVCLCTSLRRSCQQS